MATGDLAPSTRDTGPGPLAARNNGPSPSLAKRLPRLIPLLWPNLCLFQLGLLVGWFLVGGDSAPPPRKHPEDQRTHAPPAPSLVPAVAAGAWASSTEPSEELARGDQLVREGDHDAALALFQKLSIQVAPPLADAVHYRIALCEESLGHWDGALADYRTLAERSSLPTASAAAQLGQARVWFRMHRASEARNLLNELLLRSGQVGPPEHPLMAEAQYLLALALALETLAPQRPGPTTDVLASSPAAEWPSERALNWTIPGKNSARANRDSAEDRCVVQKGGGSEQEILVEVWFRQVPVAELLDRVTRASGLRLEWTPAARRLVAERNVAAALGPVPLPDLLRALADPVGLVWRIDEGVVRIAAESETLPAALSRHRLQVAQRALREALLAHPGHVLTPAASLALANLEFTEAHWQEAASLYSRLLRDHPHSPVTNEAAYNLGTTERRLGELAAARTAYFQVVDRSPGCDLAPLAYLRIGQLYLEDNDPDHALSPLRRGLLVANDASTRQALAVTLAAGYLLANNPRAANAVLLANRDLVNREPYRNAAAFLDNLARYRTLTDRRDMEREGAGLLAALLAAEEGALLGPVGEVLAGQAFGELGMVDEMATAYEKVLQLAHGPLALETTFALAEALYAAGKRTEALERYTALVARPETPWAHRAQLRIAQLALEEKQADQCLQQCQELVKQARPEELADILRLMGRAYEELGDHRRAASCYAGKVP